MDVSQPNRNRGERGRARERAEARLARRAMATPRTTPVPEDDPPAPMVTPARSGGTFADYAQRTTETYAPEPHTPRSGRRGLRRSESAPAWAVGATRKPGVLRKAELALRDFLWKARQDIRIPLAGIAMIVLIAGLYVGTHVFGQRIFPNVWALGLNVGDMTLDEATAALQNAWSDVMITLVDEERTWSMTPAQLGMRLDARATAESARDVGMGGIPFGVKILPTVTIDVLRAQNALLDMTETIKIDPYNAGYRWQGDTLIGVPGSDGRYLDVALTMETLTDDLALVADTGELNLVMTPARPEVINPEPFIEEARALAAVPFQMYGYDPFSDQRVAWSTDRDTFTSWIEAGANGLTLREETFAPFLDAQTQSLAQIDPLRYIEPTDAMEKMRTAIAGGSHEVSLRIRYRTSTYTIRGGDSGYRIARTLGVPFYLIQQANPSRDWDALLSPGDVINLPSVDAVVPLDPIPNKRIIVDLDTQQLWAYENGQLVFNWLISSGMDRAPTAPGIYQILSHNETATGSSVELCGDNSCGTWQMYWFMGIYEVFPGLINGFHGAVLLPNGAYLGGNNVGSQFTYGCIMSRDDEARLLYEWADDGTVVEIIGAGFTPRSELARRSLASAAVPSVAGLQSLMETGA